MKNTTYCLMVLIIFSFRAHALDANAFVIKVNISNPADLTFTIPTRPGSTYDYQVDCTSNGSFEGDHESANYTCSYPTVGLYQISVLGQLPNNTGFPSFYTFNTAVDKLKIVDIAQWGRIKWGTMLGAFWGASNMTVSATDVPYLLGVSNMALMFNGAVLANPDTSDWNTSNVTSMRVMFQNAWAANPDVGNWDTSNVALFDFMFAGAIVANPNLSHWDISSATDLNNMISGSAISVSNYDSMLINFDKTSTNTSINLNNVSVVRCSDYAQTAFTELSTTRSWTINDQGICTAADPANDFVIKVKTDIDGDSYTIPTLGPSYDYDVDCTNDGTFETVGVMGDHTCTYATAGTYSIRIKDGIGDRTGFPRIFTNNSGDKDKIISIDQWGTTHWTSMHRAFKGAKNLEVIATDIPDFAHLDNLHSMFDGASIVNPDTHLWDMFTVYTYDYMFYNTTIANPDVSLWNTSNVTRTSGMFSNSVSANPDVSGWNTSNVFTMNNMFNGATSANPDVSQWNTSSLHYAEYMFKYAPLANPDLSQWNIQSVIFAQEGFYLRDFLVSSGITTINYDAMLINFENQPHESDFLVGYIPAYRCSAAAQVAYDNLIIDGWTINDLGVCHISASSDDFILKVKTDNPGASEPNQYHIKVSTPSTSYNFNVDCDDDGILEVVGQNTNFICEYASAGEYTIRIKDNTGSNTGYPQVSNLGDAEKIIELKQWGTNKWQSTELMFAGAKNMVTTATDTPDLSVVTDMSSMFESSLLANPNTTNWDTSAAQNMSFMFKNAIVANPDTSNWDISNVEFMEDMFAGVTLPTTDYDNILIGFDAQVLQNAVEFSGGNSKYCALTAHANLDSASGHNWSISDGGVDSNCVNADPTLASLPALITAVEDVASDVDLSVVTFYDNDSATVPIALKITATNGSLSATTGAGVTISGSTSSQLTLTGSVINIDTYLNTVSNILYTSVLNANGNSIDTLTFSANDGGNSGTGGGTDVSLGSLNVNVTAVNDAPVLPADSIELADENQISVITILATDIDVSTTFTYSLSGGADIGDFTIGSSSGVLSFQNSPDFETQSSYQVIVKASDGTLFDTQTLTVNIQNVNEAPVLSSLGGAATASLTVDENQTTVTTILASDVDAGSTITYSITGGTDQGEFNIGTSGGVLSFVNAPDFESQPSFQVMVQASDGTLFDTQTITVNVQDINEVPVFTSLGGSATASIEVDENQSLVTTVVAVDPESQGVVYTITGGADQNSFNIVANGDLTFKNPPNFETKSTYEVEVRATENLPDNFFAIQTININLQDVNETPVIDSLGGLAAASLFVDENQTTVTTVNATDVDAGTILTYSISGGVDAFDFNMDSVNGDLTFKDAPDFETKDSYVVEVSVTDNGAPNASDSQVITVNIDDLIETSPADYFITTWKTDNPGNSNASSITVPSNSTGNSYTVDWNNDGDFDDLDENIVYTDKIVHDFGTPGIYTIRIQGVFKRISFQFTDNEKILSVDQWGTTAWSSLFAAFIGCNNLVINAQDTPNLADVTSLSSMFESATALGGGNGNWAWDTSTIDDMSSMFRFAIAFNQDISLWNTNSVTDMSRMFSFAHQFNQDISAWGTGLLETTFLMFREATAFNQDIGGWDTSSMQTLFGMFSGATVFNQNIGSWNVQGVTDFNNMFTSGSLSTSNYDSLLIGWDSQNLIQSLSFNAGNSKYCSQAATNAHNNMLNNDGWSIFDAGTTTSCIADIDLQVSIVDNTTLVFSGETIDYSVTIHNFGVEDAIGITINGLLPAEIVASDWACSSADGAVCSSSGSGSINDTADIPSNTSITYRVSATMASTSFGQVTYSVTASTQTQTDVDPNNNTASDTNANGSIIFINGFEE